MNDIVNELETLKSVSDDVVRCGEYLRQLIIEKIDVAALVQNERFLESSGLPAPGAPLMVDVDRSAPGGRVHSAPFVEPGWRLQNCRFDLESKAAPPAGFDASLGEPVLLREDGSDSFHLIQRDFDLLKAEPLALSIYARADARYLLAMSIPVSGGGVLMEAYFDIREGRVLQYRSNQNIANFRATIEPAGGKWYRCAFMGHPMTPHDRRQLAIYLRKAESGPSKYKGDGRGGLHLWGLQIETGLRHSAFRPS